MTSPLRSDAARNRDAVLQKAREQLRSRGEPPAMKDLARMAGVGIGTVYRHFPTQDALLEALGEEGMHRLVAAARKAAANPDPAEGFAQVVEYVVRGQLEDPGIAAVLENAGHNACAAVTPLAEQLGATVAEVMDRVRAVDAVRQDLSADDIRRWLVGLAKAVGTPPDEDRLQRYLALFLDAVRPRARGAG